MKSASESPKGLSDPRQCQHGSGVSETSNFSESAETEEVDEK